MTNPALEQMRELYRDKFGRYPPDMSDGRYWTLGPEIQQIETALETGNAIQEMDVDDSDGFNY